MALKKDYLYSLEIMKLKNICCKLLKMKEGYISFIDLIDK